MTDDNSYELARAKQIQINNEHLEALGLLSAKEALQKDLQPSKSILKHRKPKQYTKRCSMNLRTRNTTAPIIALDDEYFEKEDKEALRKERKTKARQSKRPIKAKEKLSNPEKGRLVQVHQSSMGEDVMQLEKATTLSEFTTQNATMCEKCGKLMSFKANGKMRKHRKFDGTECL